MNMGLPVPSSDLVERFRRDLAKIANVQDHPLGIAVSGGPDSLALLLLAVAAYPGQVEAATVDHGLRQESAAEAAFVAKVAACLGVPHAILKPAWAAPPQANIPAAAREARYASLCAWATERDLPYLLTGHHLDDQAETMLMRLSRGAGLTGLTGIGPLTLLDDFGDVRAVRPLLRWRKHELVAIAQDAGLTPVRDRSNEDPRFDRTRARKLLADTPWLTPGRLAAVASNLADCEQALAWSTQRLGGERVVLQQGGDVTLDAADLPAELQRRLMLRAFRAYRTAKGDRPHDPITGPKLIRLLDSLRDGRSATLAGVRVSPGPPWRLSPAPPRRR